MGAPERRLIEGEHAAGILAEVLVLSLGAELVAEALEPPGPGADARGGTSEVLISIFEIRRRCLEVRRRIFFMGGRCSDMRPPESNMARR
jgi:hypothetical protein